MTANTPSSAILGEISAPTLVSVLLNSSTFRIHLTRKYHSALKTGEQTFLDVGCGLGPEIRVLGFAGVPSEKLIELDLKPEFIDLGYILLREEGALRSEFVAANIFDQYGPTKSPEGKVDINTLARSCTYGAGTSKYLPAIASFSF